MLKVLYLSSLGLPSRAYSPGLWAISHAFGSVHEVRMQLGSACAWSGSAPGWLWHGSWPLWTCTALLPYDVGCSGPAVDAESGPNSQSMDLSSSPGVYECLYALLQSHHVYSSN